MRFRSVPTEIDAVQWFPGKDVPGVFDCPTAIDRFHDDGGPPTDDHPHPYVVTATGCRVFIDPDD